MRSLREGDTIGLRGPFGSAWPLDEAKGKDVVIVAGGLGMAPLRPAVHHLLANRSDYGRVVLLYGTRTPADVLFPKEIEELTARGDIDVEVTVDRASQDWKGHVGVATSLIPAARFDARNTVSMICGPEVMMRFTVRELERRGVPQQGIYVSMERNMKCGAGLCGHCQYGPTFMCKDGPVFRFDTVQRIFYLREI
jgi:NAD(P)H-flavin reductase